MFCKSYIKNFTQNGEFIMKLIKDEKFWDIEKETIFDKIEKGTFEFCNLEIGITLDQDWWKLVDYNERVLGFGWINYEQGDFEISLAVNEDSKGIGLGSFIVKELERIAKEQGFNETVAIIKQSNPNSSKIVEWFYKKGYAVYIPGLEGMERKTEELATNMVKRMDVHLIKTIV
jgi:GNAT superfamily N-acetyltransferase